MDFTDFDRKYYADFEKFAYRYDEFEVQFEYGDYYTIDFIFVFWNRHNSYKYFFTRKNNNDTWYGVCNLIQNLIVDNLTFRGLKKIN